MLPPATFLIGYSTRILLDARRGVVASDPPNNLIIGPTKVN